jgi:hypothetical protein
MQVDFVAPSAKLAEPNQGAIFLCWMAHALHQVIFTLQHMILQNRPRPL